MKRDLRRCQNWRISSVWQLAGRSITPPHAPLSQWNEERDHYLSNNDSLIYQTLPFHMSETLPEASSQCVSVCVRVCVCVCVCARRWHSGHCAVIFWHCQLLSEHEYNRAQWKCVSNSTLCVSVCSYSVISVGYKSIPDMYVFFGDTHTHTFSYFNSCEDPCWHHAFPNPLSWL